MLNYGYKPAHSPQRLLMAAKTALLLHGQAQEILWALYPDELLTISDEDHQKILEYLAMSLVDKAWPQNPEDQDF
jgi:hypothetical protein